MKKLITTFMCMVLCSMTLSAQSVVKHKVKKGETLSSIASKYNIEEWQLLLENPSASSSFRRGMILYIPSGRENATDTHTNSYTQEEYERQHVTSTRTTPIYADTDSENAFHPVFHMSFDHQFMGDAKDYYNFNLGMQYEFGTRYNFTDYVFAEAFIGYSWTMFMPKSKYNNLIPSTTNHNLTLPIHLGASLPLNEDDGLNLFIGPRFNYLVHSKQEVDGEKIKWSDIKDADGFKRWRTSLEFGFDLTFGEKALRVSYGIPFSDKKAKSNNGVISIGFVF